MELQQFWTSCVRVLKITRKPDREEFMQLTKITGLGLVVIGLVGFVIQMLYLFITG